MDTRTPYRSRMAGGMQGVTLDEDGAGADDGTTARPSPDRSTRRPFLVAAGAIVVAALAVVGTQRVLDARTESADAALAERHARTVGVVEPFDASLHPSPGPATDVDLDTAVRVAGTVVALSRDRGTWRVVGLDADDWSTRWSTDVDLVTASPQDSPYWLETGTLADVAAAAATSGVDDFLSIATDTWCTAVVRDRVAVCGVQTGAVFDGAPLSTTWWVVDVPTGAVLRTVATTSTTWVHPVGDVLVHVRGETADGGAAGDEPPVRWTVEATDPLTGDLRWTQDVTPRLASTEDGRTGPPWPDPSWDYPQVDFDPTGGGRVLVRLGASAWLLGADGAVLDETTVVGTVSVIGADRVTAARNGRVVPGSATVRGDDGLLRGEEVLPVRVDDGSLPDVAFVGRTEIVERVFLARDTDGGDLWNAPDARLPLAVLDGDVLVRTFRGLARLDGDDGSVVWSTDGGVDSDLAVTDGRTVLVRTGASLRALSWATGEERWLRTFADLGVVGEVHDVSVAPGLRRLVVSVDDERVVLR